MSCLVPRRRAVDIKFGREGERETRDTKAQCCKTEAKINPIFPYLFFPKKINRLE